MVPSRPGGEHLGVLGCGVLEVAEPAVQGMQRGLGDVAVPGGGDVAGEALQVVSGFAAERLDDHAAYLGLARERDAGEVAAGAEALHQLPQLADGGLVAAVDEAQPAGAPDFDGVQVLDVAACWPRGFG